MHSTEQQYYLNLLSIQPWIRRIKAVPLTCYVPPELSQHGANFLQQLSQHVASLGKKLILVDLALDQKPVLDLSDWQNLLAQPRLKKQLLARIAEAEHI